MAETQYILSISYGKDSLACLGAIEQLGLPLDRIIHSEVWATDDIPADPPPMVEFKAKADKIIKERWGIEVEHLCAEKDGEKLTYEKLFYHVPKRKPKNDAAWGGEDHRVPVSTTALVQRAYQNPSSTASRLQSGAGARSSNTSMYESPPTRLRGSSDTELTAKRRERSKQGSILGFPIMRGNWCTSDLKRGVFPKLPCTRSGYKYCAIPRYRRRRA